MKKKRILGIVTAMLMVIALALTGCGQQGEQNAGATGSGDENGSVDNNRYYLPILCTTHVVLLYEIL